MHSSMCCVLAIRKPIAAISRTMSCDDLRLGQFKIDEGRVLFPLIVEQTLVSYEVSTEFNVLAKIFHRPAAVTVAE
jgi:hypothetical protein